MNCNEAEFNAKFEENGLDTMDVMTEMTIPMPSRTAELESRLVFLESDLVTLNRQYEEHSNLYDVWKSKYSVISAELSELEQRSDDIVDALMCYPITQEEYVTEWVKAIREREY